MDASAHTLGAPVCSLNERVSMCQNDDREADAVLDWLRAKGQIRDVRVRLTVEATLTVGKDVEVSDLTYEEVLDAANGGNIEEI